jgi:hypothetical protein
MSTHDVPGANPDNNDELHMGCWAEHDDGSLILVESTEGNRVVYSMFDMEKEPPVEYRDSMALATFEKTFSRDDDLIWTWHDKTPFDWDRVIKAGFKDGTKPVHRDHIMSAAQRVARSLKLRGEEISHDISHRADQTRAKGASVWNKLSRAIAELGK